MLDCLVIGGGVIGLMTARELAQAGCRVVILDRGEIGRESSWAGGGILSALHPWLVPECLIDLTQWSQAYYPRLAVELQDSTGIDVECTPSGLLLIDIADAGGILLWAARHEIACELLETPSAIGTLEPHCRPTDRALWFPAVSQVRNPRLIGALREDVVGLGVELRTHCSAEEIIHAQGRVRGVRLKDRVLEAERVIIASGAWSALLVRPLGIELDITPVKGQMLLYQAPPGYIRHIVTDGDCYVIPRRDGKVLVGSTLERTDFDKSITAEARFDLSRAAARLTPDLARFEIIQQWAGLRPAAPDGIPVIGTVPGVDGLYVNAGHFRNGLLLAPGSARLLADIILGRPPILDPSPFALQA